MVKLEPGDLMLFFTDGLIENCDLGGHAIGTRKVVAWMRELYDRPVKEIRDGLERRVRAFLEDEPLADDMSFIVARVTERPRPPPQLAGSATFSDAYLHR